MGNPARRPGNQATVSALGLLTATQSYSISNYQGLRGGGGGSRGELRLQPW